jgi:hypothetical protein
MSTRVLNPSTIVNCPLTHPASSRQKNPHYRQVPERE